MKNREQLTPMVSLQCSPDPLVDWGGGKPHPKPHTLGAFGTQSGRSPRIFSISRCLCCGLLHPVLGHVNHAAFCFNWTTTVAIADWGCDVWESPSWCMNVYLVNLWTYWLRLEIAVLSGDLSRVHTDPRKSWNLKC